MSDSLAATVRRNAYVDSVTLLQVSADMMGLMGVRDAALVMASELNRQLLSDSGMLVGDAPTAGPNDLIIAVRATDAAGNLSVSHDVNVSHDLAVGHDVNVGNDINMGASTRQMLNLWSTNYALGVQNNTLYNRTDFDFCWFRGGIHANGRSDPGGGVVAMRLDSSSNLSVGGDVSMSGNLSVAGSQNIFRVIAQPFAIKMDGTPTPTPTPAPRSCRSQPFLTAAAYDQKRWGQAEGSLPTTDTKLTHSPGDPPRLWVSASFLPAAMLWMVRAAGASPRSCSQHSKSMRRPLAPMG